MKAAFLSEIKVCFALFVCGALAGLIIGLMVNVARGAL